MARILLIDDKRDNLVALSGLLKAVIPDCQVVTALSGPEGLALAVAEPPDVILLDVRMPQMDGYEVCARLKQGEATRFVPVLMLTAVMTQPADLVRGLESGAEAFLAKPVEPTILKAHVLSALRLKAAEDGLRREKSQLEEAVRTRTAELVGTNERLRQEIEDHRLARVAVQESATWWQTTFDAVADSIMVLDRDFRILRFNRATAGMLGLNASQIAESRCWELFHGTSEPIPGCPILAIQKSRSREVFAWARGERAYRICCDPILGPGGELEGAVHILSDVTAEKGLAAALACRESQQRAMAELGQRAFSGLGIADLLDDAVSRVARVLEVEIGAVLEAQDPGAGLVLRAGIGWRAGLVGCTTVGEGKESQAGFTLLVDEPVLVEDLGAETRFAGSALLREHGVVSGISVVIRGRGRPFGVLAAHSVRRRSFTPDDRRFIEGVATLVATALEREQAEREKARMESQFRQVQKLEAVGRLAGGVAHDFNNMLGVILGYANSALTSVPDDHPLHLPLSEICAAAQRSADLTRQLLVFSRQQNSAPGPIDLNERLTAMARLLGRVLGEDLALELCLTPGLWPVYLDPTQFDQIIVNLAVNARDAMPDGGRLTIETSNLDGGSAAELGAGHPGRGAGDQVVLRVVDQGIGMDPETLSRVFEPFFTTKSEGQGTGLGLSNVYGIVQQNQGNIQIDSARGQGSAVRIGFPRFSGAEVMRIEPTPERKEVPRGQETILLVEDEEMLRCMAEEQLQNLGYRVLSSAGPGDALALCEKQGGEIHLLLTDVIMPIMNGRELYEKLLTINGDVRVIYMSGYTADVVLRRGQPREEVQFLQKPFTKATLAKKIREVLDA